MGKQDIPSQSEKDCMSTAVWHEIAKNKQNLEANVRKWQQNNWCQLNTDEANDVQDDQNDEDETQASAIVYPDL